ncbi:MAG: hypothetical protein HEQ38_20545 [Gemmatimonas sp.]|nr:hypothetical protein [Gemmatimonas sp.]
MTLRLRVQPKPHNKVRVSVFVPCNGGHHHAGALDLPETKWRDLLYPILTAGAARHGVTLTLES